MKKGLIVSIQNYSEATTRELVGKIAHIAAGIRTDINFWSPIPCIAVKKILGEKYYINSTVEAIRESMWGDYVAIDCRRGNSNLDYLLAFCQVNGVKVVADIETVEDYENIVRLTVEKNYKPPAYIATTFSFLQKGGIDIELIKKIKLFPCIAEGGIRTGIEAAECYENGASNICIGAEISDIEYLAKKYII